MERVRFGIIGCGMMGREFASAAARWLHLLADVPRPEIVAVANRSSEKMEWFTKNIPGIRLATTDYRELLACKDVDAVYCAVPHLYHEQIYTDIIRAGKHLMGEKPFGIDQKANKAILAALRENPGVFCRCVSQFAFYPAMAMMEEWIEEGRFGKILEVKAGFLHSSDMDLAKPLNWKRMASVNGEYGCMGDLGMHVQYVPIRYGWRPRSVNAILSNIVSERPDGRGGMAPCDTWDNATLLCRTMDREGNEFPMTFEMKRMSPGSTNEWYLKIMGLAACAYFTTDDPGAFHYLLSGSTEQAWCRLNVGYKPQIQSITGGIFEFGATDAIQQMWAAFMMEMTGRQVKFGCARPEETALSHSILTAALTSQKEKREVLVE